MGNWINNRWNYFLIFFWADSVPIAVTMIYIHGVCIPLIMISRATIIQLHTPNKYHGRVFSVVHLGVVGTTALSSASLVLLVDTFR